MAEETTDVGTLGPATAEADPFGGCEVISGHESLGRTIRDRAGQLSGSPANYEATRGVESSSIAGTPLSEAEEAELLGWLEEQIPPAV